jgi:uncharacterized protein (DUF1501 family)
MQPTRRDFLRLGLGTSALLACGTSVPSFLARSASALAAAPGTANKDNVLVVLELTGGNDGLNTVIPYRDDEYRKRRPKLRVPQEQIHKIDDRVGLHPALSGMAKLLDSQQLAIVQSVGYPNPNRSHFQSMAIWQSGRLQPAVDTSGWLARSLDQRPTTPGGDAPALHLGESVLPQALFGSRRQAPSLVSLEQCRRRLGVPEAAGANEQRAALDRISSQERGEAGSLLQFVQRSTLVTYTSSARLEAVLQGHTAISAYPEFFGLAQRLKLIAQLIKAGLTTSIYYTHLGDFDTHANQSFRHSDLLREVGDSLKAFLDDLHQAGHGKRVLVLVFSEFGRRLGENASGGTDHGTAAPVFLLGQGVKSGLHGSYPDLQNLEDGDPKHAIDFRRVYATVLDQWLNCSSDSVLGEQFAHLPLLRGLG